MLNSSKKIELIFEAIDRSTNTMNAIDSKIDSMGKRSGFLGDALSGAFAGAGMAAFNTALDVASAGFDLFINNIQKAGKAQTDLMTTSALLSDVLDQPYESAKDSVSDFVNYSRNEFAKLPGDTELYVNLSRELIDDYAKGIKELEGEFSSDSLNRLGGNVTQTLGLLGATQGIDATGLNQGSSLLLGGGQSEASLKTYQLFQGGTGRKFLAEIANQSVEEYGKQLENLTQGQLLKLIETVGGDFFPPELLTDLEGSYEGTIANVETFMNNLFNFSLEVSNRDNRTVLEAAGETLAAIMNLFQDIGSRLGFNDQVFLEIIIDGLDILTQFIKRVSDFTNEFLNNINSGSWLEDLGNIQEIFFTLGYEAGELINQWYDSVDWAKLIENIGKVIISIFVGVVNFAAGFAAARVPAIIKKYEEMIDTIQYGIRGIIESIGDLLLGWFNGILAQINRLPGVSIPLVNEGGATSAIIPNNGQSSLVASPNFSQVNYINVTTGEGGSIASEVVRELDKKWMEYKANYNPVAI